MRAAPSFFAVPHVNGEIDATSPHRPVTQLHSELKRDWRVIVDAETDPRRLALLEPSPQGMRLSADGLAQLLKGEGPFDSATIATATAAARSEQAKHQEASAAALAAAGGPKTTTPKAAAKKKAKKK